MGRIYRDRRSAVPPPPSTSAICSLQYAICPLPSLPLTRPPPPPSLPCPPWPRGFALADSLAPSLRRLQAADAALIEDQVAIARIPAPTGAESARAEWMARRLAASGLRDVRIDDAGNVIGMGGTPRGEAPLVLCAHLDTVFESLAPVHVLRDGPRLTAPGIGDNARGLATLVALAGAFGSGAIRTVRPLLFAATTGEEGLGDLRGARHLFNTAGAGAHAAIALDGPGDERVVTAALGGRRYQAAFRGPGNHSWERTAPHAVHAAAALVTPDGPGVVRSLAHRAHRVAHRRGSTVNTIPADADRVDVRSTSAAELERWITTRAPAASGGRERVAGQAPPLSVTITVVGDRPAGGSRWTGRVQAAINHAVGWACRKLAVASTDANIDQPRIGDRHRQRRVSGDTHTPAEWFENREGARGVVRAALTVAAIGQAGRAY